MAEPARSLDAEPTNRRGRTHPRTMGRAISTLLALGIAIGAGCQASYRTAAESAGRHFSAGRLVDAEQTLRAALEESSDETSLRLDLATIVLASGRTDEAERLLQQARDDIDSQLEAATSDSIRALAVDDSARHYQAPGHEQVMVRVMLSLASMLGDRVDAHSYALQAQARQDQLRRALTPSDEAEPDSHYRPVEIASYFRGILAESTWHDFDGAARAFRVVSAARPDLPLVKAAVERAEQGVPCGPGNGVVYVIGMVGQGPLRIEQEAPVTSDALLVADRILSVTGKYSVPPTLAPITIPAVVVPDGPPMRMVMSQAGKPLATTTPITDVGELAEQAWLAERTEVIGRAAARRVIKKAAVVAAKDATGVEHPVGQLLFDLAGSAWEATERVDTRCWRNLPREIQVCRLELPAGTHSLELHTLVGSRSGRPRQTTVEVTDAGLTFLVAFAPGAEIQSIVTDDRG